MTLRVTRASPRITRDRGRSPSVVPLSEGATYWSVLSSLLANAKVAGPLVHDARIAALCLSHGIRELWSADRDFSRFPELKVTNPLV